MGTLDPYLSRQAVLLALPFWCRTEGSLTCQGNICSQTGRTSCVLCTASTEPGCPSATWEQPQFWEVLNLMARISQDNPYFQPSVL